MSGEATTIALEQQIACLKREIALRKNVYPGFVARGRMKQAEADREIERMTAALHTLMDGATEKWALVDALREEEGASVTLICDNPDFIGPDAKVTCAGSWTNWEEREFTGGHVLEALKSAKAAMDAAKGGSA